MSDDNIDIPILNDSDVHSKKPAVLPYFQASSKFTSSQNEKWRKFFNISFIFCLIIAFFFSLLGIHRRQSYNLQNNNSCSSLINDGHWISSPSKNNSFWQPETCVIKRYKYDINSVQSCLKNTNINFIGDITISRLFQYLESFVFGSITSNDDIKKKKTIERIQENGNTRLIYHQDNYFNNEYFNELLLQQTDPEVRNIYILSSGKTILNTYIDSNTNEINEAELKNAKTKWMNEFLKTLVKIQRTDNEYFIRLLTPVLNADQDKPLPKKIIEWNDYIIQVTEDIRKKDVDGKGKIHVPLSWNKLYFDAISSYRDEDRDTLGKTVVKEELNLFLNSICNSYLNTTDTTCCTDYPKTKFKQNIITILLFIFGPLSLCYRKIIQKYYLLPSVINKYIPDDDLAVHLTTVALTVYFSHFTDYTALFLKVNKQYSWFKYFGLIVIASIPIINSIETSKSTTILNSEQVNEWQGLCLIFYMIIQYCSNDTYGNLSHNISRAIVSSFMFLIGYTNYDYYYRKSNFEIVNFMYYLLKKITLPLILAFAFDGSIIDYFFPFITAFWAVIIYSTMGILASYNNQRKFFLIKLGSAIGITFFNLILLPFITKYTFILLGILFGVEWDYNQWNQDIAMDFWTVWMGVIFSYFLNNFYETADGLVSHRFNVSTINIIGIVGSIGCFIITIPALIICNKNTYDKIHPWVSSLLPIAYVVIRNSNHLMRKRISKFLCWIGSFAMEIYILYNHLFISSSTKGHGIIVYIPNSFWFNFIVAFIILAWVSLTISHSLTGICRWIISSIFNLSLSSNLYSQLNDSRTSVVHYDITGSVNFTSTINPNDEPSTSDVPSSSGNNILMNNEDNNSKETSLDNLLNNTNQEHLTVIQDPNKETLQSIQYRWIGLVVLLWIINIL